MFFYSEDVLPQPDKHTLTIMKELSAACQQNPTCLKVDPIDRLACIRRYVVNKYKHVITKEKLSDGTHLLVSSIDLR